MIEDIVKFTGKKFAKYPAILSYSVGVVSGVDIALLAGRSVIIGGVIGCVTMFGIRLFKGE